MQMNDSQRIPASREQVWAALNDPAVLKQCIRCDWSERDDSDRDFQGRSGEGDIRRQVTCPISTRPTAIAFPARVPVA
jgi:uncharacterized protein YndB with AHSA1/START domain